MFELIVIFTVSFLVLPLVDLVLGEYPYTARITKAILIVVTLIWLAILLFHGGNDAAFFPHPTR